MADKAPKSNDPDRGNYSVRLMGASGSKAPGESQAMLDDPFQETGLYGTAAGKRKVIVPTLGPGSLGSLIDLVDDSNILPQCIEAYQTNIDGFGHRLDPIVKDMPEGQKAAADAEAERLKEFFDYAYADGSFIELRKRTRKDIEATNVGYWEVIRDPKGKILRFNHLPSHSMRMTSHDPEKVTLDEKRRVGLVMKTVKLTRKFRTFVQIQTGGGNKEISWFKEYGDPRTLNSKTGEFTKSKIGAESANEVIVFRGSYHPKNPYGVPRWVGNIPSVLGSRASEEINLLYFDNKTIPPMVLTVSGGQLTKGTLKRIEDLIQNKIKGRENFHAMLVIEAHPSDQSVGAPGGGSPKIDIKPLTDQQIKDALFMNYDQANRNKNRSAFRLTPLFTGESQDFTRATAEASMRVVEEQVFRPERVSFDYFMNRWILPDLDSQFWQFKSLGPNVTLNEDLIAAIPAANEAGGMTPNIARTLLADITESDIAPIDEPWGDVPFALTIAQLNATIAATLGIPAGVLDGPGGPQNGNNPKHLSALYRQLARRLPTELRNAIAVEVKAAAESEVKRRKGVKTGG